MPFFTDRQDRWVLGANRGARGVADEREEERARERVCGRLRRLVVLSLCPSPHLAAPNCVVLPPLVHLAASLAVCLVK